MGFLDALKRAAGGVGGAAQPEPGIEPVEPDEIRRRLLSISGKGIETREEGGDVVVAWSAALATAGIGEADSEHLYRAMRVSLDPATRVAYGRTEETSSKSEVDTASGLSLSTKKSFFRGQSWGGEKEVVWSLGSKGEGGAGDHGYTFKWSQLRNPVVAAVTGAGWRYEPKL